VLLVSRGQQLRKALQVNVGEQTQWNARREWSP
jgi:hypothetical protein